MYVEVSFAMAKRIFADYGRENQFSDSALEMILAYMEELEDDTKNPILFDCIALCCEWHEYATLAEVCDAFGVPYDSAEAESGELLEILEDQATILTFDRKSSNGPFVVRT